MDELLTVGEVAKLLKVSENHTIRMFQGVAGVLDVGTAEDYLKHRRRRRMLRIPRSVLEKIVKEKSK